MATRYTTSGFTLAHAMQDSKATISAFLGEEAKDRVSKSMQTEENYFYENKKRVEKVAAVSNFLLGSPAKSYEASQYNKMQDFYSSAITDPTRKLHGLSVVQGQNFIQQYCYNTTQSIRMDHLAEHTGVMNTNSSYGHSQAQAIFPQGTVDNSHYTKDMTQNQLESLRQTGGFHVESYIKGEKPSIISKEHHIDSNKLPVNAKHTINTADGPKIASGSLSAQAVRTLEEQKVNQKLVNGGLRGTKAENIAIMRNNAVRNLSATYSELKGFTGSAQDFANIKKYGSLTQGGPQLSRRALDDIKSFQVILGDNSFQRGSKISSRYSSQAKMGANATRSFLIGNDMEKGYRVSKTILNVGAMSARLGYRASLKGTSALTHVTSNMVNRFGYANTGVGQALAKFDKSTTKMVDQSNAKRQAYKSGRKKEWKQQQRIERKAQRAAKPADKLNTYNAKKENAKLKGDYKQESYYSQKYEKQKQKIEKNTIKRQNKLNKKAQRLERIKNSKAGKFFTKMGKKFEPIKNTLGKVFKAPVTVLRIINSPIEALKMFIQKKIEKIISKIMLPIGIFFLKFVVIIAVVATLVVLVVKFFSEDNEANAIHEELANVNFCQIITDDVTNELERSYMTAVGKDAQRYYSDFLRAFDSDDGETQTEIAYSGYDGEAGEGLRYGTNVPYDERIYDWFSEAGFGHIGHIREKCTDAEVKTMSNMLPIMSMLHFRYEDALDFEHFYQMKAYAYYMWVHSREETGYSKSVNEFCCVGGEDLDALSDCTNVYKHGYDWSTLETSWADQLLSRIRDVINDLIGEETSIVAEMLAKVIESTDPELLIYWDTVPRDTVYLRDETIVCDNYVETITDTLRLSFEEEGKYLEGPPADFAQLHYAELADVQSLYADCKLANGVEHDHSSGCNSNNCSHICDSSCANGCSHTCDDTCCSLVAHTHTDDCYVHKYECLGHCAGHFTPFIDVKVNMCWESLAVLDQFKTPYFMTKNDFCSDLNITHPGEWVQSLIAEMNVRNWRNYWTTKMERWFVPLPDSHLDFLQSVAECVSARIADWYVRQGEEEYESDEDYYDFEGYNILSGGSVTPNPEMMEELTDFYDIYTHGDYENSWKEGRELWGDFDVAFPMGGCYSMAEVQIEEYMENARKSGRYSEQELILLESILNCIGNYTYSLIFQEPSGSECGRMDCSGWVCTVLMRAGIWSMDDERGNWTSIAFANAGTANDGNYHFGEILAKNNTATAVGGQWQGGGTNHTLIVLGSDFDIRIDDDREVPHAQGDNGDIWIADCTSTMGGASIRKVSRDYLDSYGYQYNPF